MRGEVEGAALTTAVSSIRLLPLRLLYQDPFMTPSQKHAENTANID